MSKLRHTLPIAIAATLGTLIGVFADQSIDGKVVLGFMTALLVMLSCLSMSVSYTHLTLPTNREV